MPFWLLCPGRKGNFKELGATFRMIIIEPPQGNWAKLLQDLKPLNNRKTWNEILYSAASLVKT